MFAFKHPLVYECDKRVIPTDNLVVGFMCTTCMYPPASSLLNSADQCESSS